MKSSNIRVALLTSLTASVVLCLGAFAFADNTAPRDTNLPGGQGNLTPEQMKAIMAYRYLQSRGGSRGQVKRGVPQFIPFGALGYGNLPQDVQAQQAGGADPAAAPTSDRDAKKEAARQKRVETLKAAAEKKKAAREARAQQRKAQQGQDPVAGAK